MTPINKDTARQLLARSRAAIARFERAKAGGSPVDLAEAHWALERCHAEVKRFVALDLDTRVRSFEAAVIKSATPSASRPAYARLATASGGASGSRQACGTQPEAEPRQTPLS